MGKERKRLPPEVVAALEDTGLPWRAENGGRHIKLYLGDRMVGISPYSGHKAAHGRSVKNAVSQIWRSAREQWEQA